MVGQPRNTLSGRMAGMAEPFERRSIVLTLQELADKTPADEPLLVTRAEYRAFLDFQMSRAVKPSPEVSTTFNGRRFLIIDEQKVGLNEADMRRLIDQKKAYIAEMMVTDQRRQGIVALVAALREAFGQKPISPEDQARLVAQVNALKPENLASIESQLRSQLTDIENMKRLANMPSNVPNLQAERGGNVMFMGEGAAVAPAQLEIQRRELVGKLRLSAEEIMASRDPRDDVPEGWSAVERKLDPPDFAPYRSGENQASERVRISPAAFVRAVGGLAGGVSTAPRDPPVPVSTEKPIPVGVARGYFEE